MTGSHLNLYKETARGLRPEKRTIEEILTSPDPALLYACKAPAPKQRSGREDLIGINYGSRVGFSGFVDRRAEYCILDDKPKELQERPLNPRSLVSLFQDVDKVQGEKTTSIIVCEGDPDSVTAAFLANLKAAGYRLVDDS